MQEGLVFILVDTAVHLVTNFFEGKFKLSLRVKNFVFKAKVSLLHLSFIYYATSITKTKINSNSMLFRRRAKAILHYLHLWFEAAMGQFF